MSVGWRRMRTGRAWPRMGHQNFSGSLEGVGPAGRRAIRRGMAPPGGRNRRWSWEQRQVVARYWMVVALQGDAHERNELGLAAGRTARVRLRRLAVGRHEGRRPPRTPRSHSIRKDLRGCGRHCRWHRDQARPRHAVVTTSFPFVWPASMAAWASTIWSKRYTWSMGTTAVPAATASRNPCRTVAGRSAASPL
jgi:hypothetical protein